LRRALSKQRGDHTEAQALFEEGLSIRRATGDKPGEAWALSHLGGVARSFGNPAEARALFEKSLALFRELEDKLGSAWALCHLGDLVCSMDSCTDARALLAESLTLFRELGDMEGLATCLSAFAGLFALSWPGRAVCLWSASQSLRKKIGLPMLQDERAEYEGQISEARSTLGDDAFELAWGQGDALTGEQAAAYALEEAQISPQRLSNERF
jgi:tetratricopeptide (TPR) repeat protein